MGKNELNKVLPLFVVLWMGWGWEGDSGRTTSSKGPWSICSLREKSVQTDHGPFEHFGPLGAWSGEVVVVVWGHSMKGSYETHGVGLGRREDS